MSEPERLVLTESQSEHVRGLGGRFFAVVSPGSYPENVGRMVLDLLPCDYQTAVDAIAVAQGTARAVKIKPKAQQ